MTVLWGLEILVRIEDVQHKQHKGLDWCQPNVFGVLLFSSGESIWFDFLRTAVLVCRLEQSKIVVVNV